MNCFIDGDCLCIVKDDFVNLQESEAVFIKLTVEQIKEISEFDDDKPLRIAIGSRGK